MSLIGVRDAAERLGVSPRRVLQRIEDGTLPSVRVGSQWAIDPAHLPLARGRPSRPLSAHMAWALLDYLDGGTPDVAPTERKRLHAYADRLRQADDPATLLRAWMEKRADRHEYRAAAADLDDLRDDERLLRSGASTEDSFIVSPVAEAYVAASDLDTVVDDYFLVPATRPDGNVILHVVAKIPARIAWPVLAADLAEHLGSRESARVAELVRDRLPRE
ncbi:MULTISPECIES: helix-turn-helix domain-containing protein [Mumia]|uniref:helix-turn-helix domain-containing protein n=1 Tax=Mumia TaxID=1546255 RepID=UPI0014211F05|nr:MULTISPECIES: helix-turn-helix domain-containing protein [unclassified Mumia]QMW66624.1 helix-turn-helix domain-containing protein [Mumia sp. ZJ1417]